MSRNNRTDCDCDIEISHSLTMVVICRPLLLPKAHKKQFNQISCKNTLLLQSFRSITVNSSPFYHQSSDIRTICRELKKTSENNRSRWLSKNNRTDCDGKKWPKTSTSHRCYKKNIGIASLSKIDHRWSLIYTHFFCKLNLWLPKRILHLVSLKNLFFLYSYNGLLCPLINYSKGRGGHQGSHKVPLSKLFK